MRKLMTALLFSITLAGVGGLPALAAPSPETDQTLILKKKKRLAALKAAAAAEEKAIARAEVAAKKKKAAQQSKTSRKGVRVVASVGADSKRKPASADRLLQARARKRECEGLLRCLFARKQRPVRVASIDPNFTGSSGSGVSGRTARQTVDWTNASYKPGSIVVKTQERALYFIQPGGEAIRYSVGVGKEGFQWSGRSTIVRKQEWPSWTPPQVMIEREAAKGHIIPPFMEGGPGNPLGARALYIGGTMFRVHGTNNEASIGGAVSSGCIRMMNADVVDLFERVRIGAKIHVIQ